MTANKNFPAGWVLAPLRDAATINPPNPVSLPPDSMPVSFVPMAAVEELTGRMTASTKRFWSDVKKGFTRFQDGDIVFAKITPSMENGKVALATGLVNGVAAGTTEFHVFRPRSGVTGRYLLHYLLQETFRRRARARMTGTAGQLRVPTRFLEEETVPLAPSAEQRRIVEAVDSYLSRLDDAVASLERVQAKLKAYRTSVLKAAIEGRLVPTEAALARAENRDYEPADVLLSRILKERRRRWEEAELSRLKAAGNTPKGDKWRAKYVEAVASDTSRRPGLPEGWCWATLGIMKEFSLYGPRFSSDDYANDGVLVLRTSDISEAGRVDLTTPPRLILSDEDFERYQAKRGDLLITRTGSLGTVAVLDDDVSAIAGAYLIQYRLAAPIETTWFTFYFLKSPRAQMQLVQRGQGVGRPNLNVPTIDSILIPLPPLAEQIRMMDEIRRLTSVSDELMVDLSAAVQRSVRLRQAILKWAFEGKLVDQYPSDEPADRLLARIRAEPGGAVPKKKSRRPKKGPS